MTEQRKGQWLLNALRKGYDGPNESHIVAQKLWNLSDKEFDKIFEEYSKTFVTEGISKENQI